MRDQVVALWGNRRRKTFARFFTASIFLLLTYRIGFYEPPSLLQNDTPKESSHKISEKDSSLLVSPNEVSFRHNKTDSFWKDLDTTQDENRYYIYPEETISKRTALLITASPLKRHALIELSVHAALETHRLRTFDPKEATFFIVPTPITSLISHGCLTREIHHKIPRCRDLDDAVDSLISHPIFINDDMGRHHIVINVNPRLFSSKHLDTVPLSQHYPKLKNVIVANRFDPLQVHLIHSTKRARGHDYEQYFKRQSPLVTRAGFSMTYDIESDIPLVEASIERFDTSKYHVFYRTRAEPFKYNSTPYQFAPLNYTDELEHSSIGFDLPKDRWRRHLRRSKFCLVIRGDSPDSHALAHAVRSGCIPVVISDWYNDWAGPFKSSLNMNDYCIMIKEQKFIADPLKALRGLERIERRVIERKVTALAHAQRVIFPDHRASLFVEAFLKEASNALALADQMNTDSKLPYTNDRPLTTTSQQQDLQYYIYPEDSTVNIEKNEDNHCSDDFDCRDPLSELVVHEALEAHVLRTTDPTEADFYIVPTPISFLLTRCFKDGKNCTDFDNAFDALTSHPIFIDDDMGKHHIIISLHWIPFNARWSHRAPYLSRNYPRLANTIIAGRMDSLEVNDILKKNRACNNDYKQLFRREGQLVTRAGFSLGPGIETNFPMITPTMERFDQSKFFIFYRTRIRGSSNNSTIYRHAPLNLTKELAPSSIGYDLPKNEWLDHSISSQFCLSIRGDTPESHAFTHAIRCGCIPVVISDWFQGYAGPLKSTLNMSDFSIIINEQDFIENALDALHGLRRLDRSVVERKINALAYAQRVLFPDHPKSLFVPSFLKEASVALKIADERNTDNELPFKVPL